MKLTREDANRLFDYNKETGIFTWKISVKGSKGKGNIAGTLAHNGYIDVCINYKKYGMHRIAFLIETGEVPRCVDHKNGIKSDNRWENLRPASVAQNSYNYKGVGSKTGYKNVYYDKRGTNHFYVYLIVNKKRIHGGYYATPEEGAIRATELRNRYHGEFANHGDKKVDI